MIRCLIKRVKQLDLVCVESYVAKVVERRLDTNLSVFECYCDSLSLSERTNYS